MNCVQAERMVGRYSQVAGLPAPKPSTAATAGNLTFFALSIHTNGTKASV